MCNFLNFHTYTFKSLTTLKIVNHICYSLKFPIPFCNFHSLCVIPSPQATNDLLFRTVDQFACSSILYKWNHTVRILWLLLVTLRLIHIHISTIHSFLFLSSICYMGILKFFIYSYVGGHMGYFQFFLFKKLL